MTSEDELKSLLLKRLKPKEEPLLGRHYSLPHKRIAFIYQRQSSYEQKAKHIWSQKDQDDLATLAQRDGYPEELIYVERRDLGISGGKTEKDRPGLAYLMSLVEQDKVESLWAVEAKRIYRDLDYINADRLALLLREHRVVICTPRQVFNLANENDWDDFHQEMIYSVKDSRYRTEKFSRTRQAKARCGFWCGTPVPAGYIVKKGDRDSYDIIELYQVHATVVDKIYDALIDAQGSNLKAARILSGVEFPFFPEELNHMVTRTSLRRSPKTATGYKITPKLIHDITRNPFYIGYWIYAGDLISVHHHPPIPKESKFWQAFELNTAKGKPRGKAINSQTLPLTGLLYCANHQGERSIAANGARGRYACNRDYYQGLSRNICLDINHQFLDKPIIEEVFRGLKSSGLLVELEDDVVEDLRQEINQSHSEQRKLRADINDVQQRIEIYKWQLGETRDPQRVETYWEQIRKSQEQLSSKEEQLSQTRNEELSKREIISVIKFLRDIRGAWDEQPSSVQNQFLRQLLDKVMIRHNRQEIEVVICWHTGIEQKLWIRRTARNKNWSNEEDILLKELWPSLSKEIIMAALPGRSWLGISIRAHRLGLKRTKVQSVMPRTWRQWTPEEDEELARTYQDAVPLEQLAMKLGRSKDAVECRASLQKLKRGNVLSKSKKMEWENLDERVSRLEPQKFIDNKSQSMWSR